MPRSRPGCCRPSGRCDPTKARRRRIPASAGSRHRPRATRLRGPVVRTPAVPLASCPPTGRPWGGTGLLSPREASLGRPRLQVPKTGRPPLRREFVTGSEGKGPIVRLEGLAVSFELLKRDALPRPRIRVPVVLLDRLLISQQGHPSVASFEGQLGELQQDMCLFLVGLDRFDEGLEVGIGGRR